MDNILFVILIVIIIIFILNLSLKIRKKSTYQRAAKKWEGIVKELSERK
tara:strand:+ start:47 stop:193 length:147 start_codon:yes stop_codon:yes gene_type:complete